MSGEDAAFADARFGRCPVSVFGPCPVQRSSISAVAIMSPFWYSYKIRDRDDSALAARLRGRLAG